MAELLQLYYTSCKKGISSGAGFQTYSMSDGITHDERLEIEKNGTYMPPNDLPGQPTQEEITRLFPVTFKFFRLKSGRYGVCQSVYIGQDYTSRYGNYFCHALVLKNGIFPFYPIQLFNSSIFRKRLTKDEDNISENPPPLNTINLDEINLNNNITFDSISNFLDENERGDFFKIILTSIINFESSNRRLVLCDLIENIPYWIGAVQMAFPIDMGHFLTFTTYSFDPEGDNSSICATSRTGGKFQFNEYQKDYQFYIFDFLQNNFSHIDKIAKYAEVVNTSYMFSPDSLNTFHDFIKNFNYNIINNELEYAFNLFQITNSGLNEVTYDEIVQSIEFANKYASSELLGKLSQKIGSLRDIISQNLNFNVASIMTEFLFKISLQTKDKKHVDIAYNFFLTSLNYFIFRNVSQIETDKIFKYNNETLLQNKNNLKEFIFFYSKYLGNLKQEFTNRPGAIQAKICIVLCANNFLSANMKWKDASQKENFLPLIKQCCHVLKNSENDFYETLLSLSADNDFFSQYMAFCIHNEKDYSFIMNPFIKIMESKDENYKLDIRKRLINLQCENVVINEFIYLLDHSKKPTDFFWNYYNSIFSSNEKFKSSYFSIAVKNYWDMLKPKYFLTEGYNLLKDYDYIKLSDLRNIIIAMENSFSFEKPSDNELEVLTMLKYIKSKTQIAMSLDLTKILLFGVYISQDVKRTLKLSEAIKNKKRFLEGLNEKKYKAYLDWFLPAALEYFPDKNSRNDNLFHKHLIECLIQKNMTDVLAKRYIKYFQRLLKNMKKKKIISELSFFISFYLDKSDSNDIEIVKKLMTNDLINILSKDKSILKDINKNIQQTRNVNTAMGNEKNSDLNNDLRSKRIKWNQIYNMAIEKKEPFFKRLFSSKKNSDNNRKK